MQEKKTYQQTQNRGNQEKDTTVYMAFPKTPDGKYRKQNSDEISEGTASAADYAKQIYRNLAVQSLLEEKTLSEDEFKKCFEILTTGQITRPPLPARAMTEMTQMKGYPINFLCTLLIS